MEKKMNNKGFSLVELIVVIAIMAVLVGVLAPQFIKYVEKSRQSTDVTNLDSIKTVVESYYADKEGTDLPYEVQIDGSTKTYVVSIKKTSTDSFSADTKATDQGGVTGTALKGKWTKGNVAGTFPKAVWNIGTNTWTYSANSDYYGINGSGQIASE